MPTFQNVFIANLALLLLVSTGLEAVAQQNSIGGNAFATPSSNRQWRPPIVAGNASRNAKLDWRNASPAHYRPASDAERPLARPVEHVLNNGTTPDWQEAGTLFLWSFSDETGGPNLDEPLVTDRPDFTEASSTVGRGVAQVEFGYTFTHDNILGVSTRTHSVGEPLLRYGFLANWLEFRAAIFPVGQRTTMPGSANSTRGTEDIYLGLKIGLTPQAGIAPEMSLIPQMTIPTGSAAFTNDETLPGLNWIYGWEINEFISTAGSSQINRSIDGGTGQAYLEFAQSWTVGYTLSEKLGLYTEYFALIPHSADTVQPQHFFNFGFTYLVSNDIQWDIRYGKGLNRFADDYFIGTGLSIRFH